MKFLVLSLFVVACSAVPATYNYGSTFTSTPSVGLKYGGWNSPRVNLVSGGFGGYSSGNWGGNYLSSGFLGNSFNYLRNGFVAQPSATILAAAPAAYSWNAAPAISYAAAPAIQVAAAPAVQSFAIAQPTVAVQKVAQVAYAAPAVQSHSFQGVVPAAIQQVSRTVEYRPFANVEQPINAQVIEVEPSDNPVHLHFKTRSSTLTASQSHTPAAPQEVQTAAAQDEPSRLITEVQKPIIQEVREVISPFRQVTQEINPVQESLHTVVSKGEGHRQQYVAQQYVPQQQTYVAQAQPIAVQSVQQVQPLVQSVQVQPVQSVQAVAVEAAPVAVATQVAAPVQVQASYVAQPALATGYTTSFAQPAISTGYSSHSWAAPAVQSSSILVQKPALIQKQISIEKPAVFSSSSSSGY